MLSEKSHSSLTLNHIWPSVSYSMSAGVPSTLVWARSGWLGWREHMVCSSNPLSFASLVFPSCLHPELASAFTKPPFCPRRGEFKQEVKGDMAMCAPTEPSFSLVLPGTSGLCRHGAFPGRCMWGRLRVALSFTLPTSHLENHSQRGSQKCLPQLCPRVHTHLVACGRVGTWAASEFPLGRSNHCALYRKARTLLRSHFGPLGLVGGGNGVGTALPFPCDAFKASVISAWKTTCLHVLPVLTNFRGYESSACLVFSVIEEGDWKRSVGRIPGLPEGRKETKDSLTG